MVTLFKLSLLPMLLKQLTLSLITAFILYRQHYQAAVVAQNPGLANPEISKIIGEQWRALPNETKSEWKALAEVNQHNSA
mgnify:CR=1 FL=1